MNVNRVKIRFSFIILCAIMVLSLTVLSACDLFNWGDGSESAATPGTPHTSAQGIEDRYTRSSEKIVNFSKGESDGFMRANGYGNGGMFNCVWSAGNAVVSQGIMNMSVTKNGGIYFGAEYRSHASYSYGFYSVSMKAAKCSGVISSFFTYTRYSQWDEIDIEFLGKDTTKVQFNYYTNGVGGHEYLYNLGFDASEGFHEYAFDWQEDYIVWYVDGKAVYKATKDIPSHAGQIMMNVWNATGMDGWVGALDESKLPATAQYGWIGYSDSTVEDTGSGDGNDEEANDGNDGNNDNEQNELDYPDKVTSEGDKIADFAYGAANGFSKSDGWSNGGMFNCTWRQGNVNFNNGTMDLTITQDGLGYAGGEYRSNDRYSYGYFSVSMKPAKCAGTVSSFFTYTGESDGQPWDEIDIEFLGKDTTKVQFNYYTDGVGGHEHLFNLGFDASDDYHEYGFDWQSNKIVWYVDGKAVYEAKTNIPSHSGKIMTNLWNGIGVDGWLDAFAPASLPVTARYKWVAYKAAVQ